MAIIGEAFVALRPETTRFGEETKTKLEGILGGAGSGLGGAANKVGLGVVAAAAVVGAASVDMASKFQTATTSIAANAGIDEAAADRIGKAFLNTAGTTEFSGNEIAKAYATVAGQLGQTEGHALSSKEAMDVMRASMDLATSTGAKLDDTTSSLSKIMQAYGISVGDAGKTTDALFNIARLTGTGVTDLDTVIARLHSRLGPLAPSLKDVGGLMVDLAGHGVSGSRGVMVVTSAMEQLVGGGKKATDELNALGVHVFDQQGKFIGLQAVISQLQPKLAGMSDQQRNAALNTLFGAGAAQVMGSVIAGGAPGLTKAIGQVGQLGDVHKAAEEKAKTLPVELKTIRATAEDLGTKLGLLLIPALNDAGHAFASLTNWMLQHKPVAEALGIVIGVLLAGAVAHLAISMTTSLVSGVARGIASLLGFGATATTTAATTTTTMDAALAQISAAVTGIAEEMGVAVDASAAGMETTAAAAEVAGEGMTLAMGPVGIALLAVAAIAILVATHWKTVSHVAEEVAKAVVGFFGGVVDWFKANWIWILRALLAPFTGGLTLIIPLLIKFHDQIISFFEKLPGELLDLGVRAIKALVQGFVDYEKFVFDFWIHLPGRILEALGDVGKWLWDTGKKIIEGLIHGAEEGIKDLPNLAGKIGGGLIDGVGSLFGISSPSRVFAGFGMNLMEGLAMGIANNAHLPQVALHSVTLASPQLPGVGPLAALGGPPGSPGAQLLLVLQQLTHETRLNTEAVATQTAQSRQPQTVKVQQPGTPAATSPIAGLVSGLTR